MKLLPLALLTVGCGYAHGVSRSAASGTPAAAPTAFAGTTLYAGSDAREASADGAGNVWIATASGVRAFTSAGQLLSFQAADGLVSDDVRCAAGGKAGTALVGFGPSIDWQTHTSPQIEALTLSGTAISGAPKTFALTGEIVQANQAAYDPARDQYWIGTNEGISIYTAAGDAIEHRHPVHPHGPTLGVAITPSGDVWDADQFQLSRLNAGPAADFDATFDPVLEPFASVQQDLASAAIDSAGRVWAGSFDLGLARLDPKNFTVEVWSLAAGLPSLAVQSVAVDPDGSLWVATGDAGLGRLDPTTGIWKSYRASAGLPADDVLEVTIDSSASPRRLLVTTAVGVVGYDGP